MPIGCKIPFTGLKRQYQNLKEETLDVVDRVLSSGQLMNGQYTQQFESWLAAKNRCHHAITCHSGTQALEIIAEYVRRQCLVDHQPIVLIPSMTYVATVNAFIRAGWDIHFADVDQYGIIDFTHVQHIDNYQSVALVGLYGASMSNLPGPWNIWQNFIRYNRFLIEDAAQHWLANDCIRQGIGSAISFDPTKNLANFGNGGAVITDDDGLAEYALGWRSNGQKGYKMSGTNSRMSEIDCATMLVKTKYIDQWQERRRNIAHYWCDRIKDAPGIRPLIDDTNSFDHSFHKFVIDVDLRDELMLRLAQDAIETKIHYQTPLHEVPQFHHYPGPGFLNSASSLARRVLSLPIYPELTDEEVDYIIDRVLARVSSLHN